MKTVSTVLLTLLAGCGSSIIHHETDSVNLICRFHNPRPIAQPNYAGCYWRDWSGCHVVYEPGDELVRRHEEEHCRRGNWHPAGLTRDDLEKEAQHANTDTQD